MIAQIHISTRIVPVLFHRYTTADLAEYFRRWFVEVPVQAICVGKKADEFVREEIRCRLVILIASWMAYIYIYLFFGVITIV
jgi:hypothetical protein